MNFLELPGNDAKTQSGNTVNLRCYHCGRQMRVQLDLCKMHHTYHVHTTLTKAPDKNCLIQIDEVETSAGVFVARIINHSTMFPASPVVFGGGACPLRSSACQSDYGRY